MLPWKTVRVIPHCTITQPNISPLWIPSVSKGPIKWRNPAILLFAAVHESPVRCFHAIPRGSWGVKSGAYVKDCKLKSLTIHRTSIVIVYYVADFFATSVHDPVVSVKRTLVPEWNRKKTSKQTLRMTIPFIYMDLKVYLYPINMFLICKRDTV